MLAAHEDIERLAYQLWQGRGCPPDSPDVDWHRAERELSESNGAEAKDEGKKSGARPSAAPPQRAVHRP